MRYDMKEWFKDVIAQPVKKPLPIITFPAITLMGLTVRDLIGSSEYQAEAMSIIVRETDCAASVSFMDLSVEAECFGSRIKFSDDEVPTVLGSIVTDEDEAEALTVPPVGAGRTGLYLKAVESAQKTITDRPVLAGSIGPFSLAGRLLDVSEALALCYEEPELVHTVLKKAARFITEYLKAYKAIGANGAVMAEPLAGLLPPSLSWEFSGQYVKEITDAVQDDFFAVVYHNCGGNAILMIDDILKTGAAAYHFGNAISMAEMMPHIPSDIPAMGNVSPSDEILGGTPDSVRAATLKVMEDCCKYPNFIISTGCDVPPTAPWANIRAFYNAAEEYYAR